MDDKNFGEIIFYEDLNGNVRVEVLYENETVWLTNEQMTILFGKARTTIVEHIGNIYQEGELEQLSTCRKFRQVRQEGGRVVEREIDYYNLDVIISVGYRIKSKQGVDFRRWATKTLKEYIIKGFVLDSERLKQGKNFGKDYFEELLEKIREIRASERRFYQKITDIYEQCRL